MACRADVVGEFEVAGAVEAVREPRAVATALSTRTRGRPCTASATSGSSIPTPRRRSLASEAENTVLAADTGFGTLTSRHDTAADVSRRILSDTPSTAHHTARPGTYTPGGMLGLMEVATWR